MRPIHEAGPPPISASRNGRPKRSRNRFIVFSIQATRTKSSPVLVHEGNGHAALAHARGDALDRSVADVACSENAGHARLEQIRIALDRPVAAALRVEIGNVAPGADVAAGPAYDGPRQPVR